MLVKKSAQWLIVALLILSGLLVLVVGPFSKIPSSGLSGTIFISSSDDVRSPFLQAYALSFKDRTIALVGADDASIGDMYDFSPDGVSAVFVGTNKSRVAQAIARAIQPGAVMQVYRANNLSGGSVPLVSNAQAITQDADPGKQSPVISDDGRQVLYVTTTDSSGQNFAAYSIHLISGDASKNTVLANGIQPRWLSNDSFYYVAPDGVRLYTTSTQQSSLILPIPGQSNFKLSVSRDHRFMAFSNPDARKVFVFAISSGGRLLQPVKEIPIFGFWSIFSPDGRYLAIQTADEAGTHPRLSFFDTASFTDIGRDISLDPFLNDRLFVTDWK